MSLALQSLAVGLVVLGCALYSAWRLMSPRLRLRALDALERLPRALITPWSVRLRQRTLARLTGGCDGCAAGGATPAAASRNRTPGALRR